jgi:hypothetical protein
MTDSTNGTNGKAATEKLGIIPATKIAGLVGAKVWDAHQKNLAALNAAKEATATSKAAVITALAKALKLPDPATLHFWSDAEKLTLGRRPEKHATRRAVLRDLSKRLDPFNRYGPQPGRGTGPCRPGYAASRAER